MTGKRADHLTDRNRPEEAPLCRPANKPPRDGRQIRWLARTRTRTGQPQASTGNHKHLQASTNSHKHKYKQLTLFCTKGRFFFFSLPFAFLCFCASSLCLIPAARQQAKQSFSPSAQISHKQSLKAAPNIKHLARHLPPFHIRRKCVFFSWRTVWAQTVSNSRLP